MEIYAEGNYLYLCSEVFKGGDVSNMKEPMDEDTASKIIKKVLRALQHCHSQGILHKNIKPKNLMYGVSNEIKLVDFGFAISIVQDVHRAHTVCDAALNSNKNSLNSDVYEAPEGKIGDKCDVWSLGITLYWMLTGQIPPFGENDESSSSESEKSKNITKED